MLTGLFELKSLKERAPRQEKKCGLVVSFFCLFGFGGLFGFFYKTIAAFVYHLRWSRLSYQHLVYVLKFL